MRAIVIWAAVVLVSASGVRAQDADLSSEARVALDRLIRAGWSGQSTVNGFGVTVREAAVFSAGVMEGVEKPTRCSDAQRAALADVARIECAAPGWFWHRHLPAGTYHVGVERTERYLRWVLRDPKQQVVGVQAFWLTGRSDDSTTASVTGADGAMVARITVGGIEFAWRFVPEAAHETAVGVLPRQVTAGPVVLHTDLPDAAGLQALAEECAAAVPVHAALLGVDVPKEPLHLYCFTDEAAYQAVDRLCTGGRFAEQGAFTSSLTRRAYVWYVPYATPIAFDDAGPTRKMRALLLHELHHVIARRFFDGADAWPNWLAEGLAEVGTWKAFVARDPAAATWFVDQARGLWQQGARVGDVPSAQNLFGDVYGGMVHQWYAGAFLAARLCEAQQPGGLASFLPYIEGEPVERVVRPRLLQQLERMWKPTPQLQRDVAAAADAGGPAPCFAYGHAQRQGDVWRVISPPKGQARVLLPELLAGPDLEFTAEYAWHPVGAGQADVYLAYRDGRGTAQFLKVALLPTDITLLRYRDGEWQNWRNYHFERPLTVGAPKQPTWHPLTITLDAANRVVKVETTGGRSGTFPLPEYVPTAETQVGFGCYDGIAFFKNVRAR